MQFASRGHRRFLFVLDLACIISCVPASPQTVRTYAGGGPLDGAVATQSAIQTGSIAVARNGQALYLSDSLPLPKIFKLDQSGTVSLVIGPQMKGRLARGDGGKAIDGTLWFSADVAEDDQGNLFVLDFGGTLVRRIDAQTGIISAFAGSFAPGGGINCGSSGNGGLATSAAICARSIATDSDGNVYISDGASGSNNSVRRVDIKTGIINNVAGNEAVTCDPAPADGVPAWSAEVCPTSVAVDRKTGNIYISEGYERRIRVVDISTGLIKTVMKSTGTPFNIAIDDAEQLYISDSENGQIQKFDIPTGKISVVAGNLSSPSASPCAYSGDGMPSTQSALCSPGKVAVDETGNVYFADWGTTGNPEYQVGIDSFVHRIDKQTGILSTVSGNGNVSLSGDGGLATAAQMSWPGGIVQDSSGNLFILDTGNNLIRRVDHTTGKIDTIAGTGKTGFAGDGGPATSAEFNIGFGSGGDIGTITSQIAVDTPNNIYFADTQNQRIRRIDSTTGIITTVAGNGFKPTFPVTGGYVCPSPIGDGGNAVNASLCFPTGLALDAKGRLFVADPGNYRIRMVDPSSQKISTYAGNGSSGFSGDGGPALQAQLSDPFLIATDQSGNLYLTEDGTECNGTTCQESFARIRKVDSQTETISTVAGTGTCGGLANPRGDGGPATDAQLCDLSGLAIDSQGNLFIDEHADYRRVDAKTNQIRTGPPATSDFNFQGHGALIVDRDNNLLISDTRGLQVLQILFPQAHLSGSTLDFGGELVTTTVAKSVTLSNTTQQPLNIASISSSAGFSETDSCGTQLAPQSSCTLTATFSPAVAGAVTGTVTINDDAADSPQTLGLSGTGTDFTLAGSPGTVTVSPGGAATFTITITPLSGFNGMVTFACSGAPSLAKCSINPTTATLNGKDPATVQLSVSTTAPTTAALRSNSVGLLSMAILV